MGMAFLSLYIFVPNDFFKVVLANDFYMDLCIKNNSVEGRGQSALKYQLFIVAAESGAYLVCEPLDIDSQL